MKLTEQNYWVNAQGNINLNLADNNPIKVWIENNFNFSKINNCIEIGCFPGRYLTIFGNQGIEVNGLDFIPEIEMLKTVFENNNYLAGHFINADFTNYNPKKKYDCVVSFGFIEHFKNWNVIFEKHIDYVNENGYIIIEVPNFRGFFQRLPRYLFDFENYKRHNIESMNIESWKKILIKHNFEIVNAEYFGGYELWNENNNKNRFFLTLKFIVEKALLKIKRLVYPNISDHRNFSSYMGIIAKKNV
ncbi:class I SAM-dependent methyltransferase [Flavobacterium ardleyense]|uniref:Class I SAM-dependent methyltransferase n=2 Tax=Flavobacterium ardleyense TaxID=2038737 RepID=A0ABW5ZAX5_9FLAO